MQAIILAGGFGTRLKPIVHDVPKPMAPLAGRPFLRWLLGYMAGQGVREAVLCLHHQHETIRHYFGDWFAGVRLHYSIEEKPLGTGGAIRAALAHLDPEEPVFALNGDSLVEIDYRHMYVAHLREGRPITLATRHVLDCRRYSQLTIQSPLPIPLPCTGEGSRGKATAGEGDFVVRYDVLGKARAGDISAGLYILSPHLFDGFELPEAFSFERDFLAAHVPALRPAAYHGVDYFIDIGVPKDYARAMGEVPQRILELAA